jgi:flagellar assembly protein FliH
VSNALRGIRETRQYKIRVCEEEVSVLREHRQELQEQVGEDMTIEIVMDPDLSKSQCIIEADSGVYDCSLDAELDHLSRDLRSISASSVPLQD